MSIICHGLTVMEHRSSSRGISGLKKRVVRVIQTINCHLLQDQGCTNLARIVRESALYVPGEWKCNLSKD